MSKTTLPTGGITADAINSTLIADDAVSEEHLDATALTGNAAGLTIALVHLLFNILGMLLLYPVPFLRRLPIICSKYLATLVEKSKLYGVAYILLVFFLVPLFCVYTNR